MKPVVLLLQRPSAFSGLGLIATMSALTGPLCLEVLFNHSDLWFSGPWQDQAFAFIWLAWTLMGLIVSSSWGLDRGFNGILPEIHRTYSLLLSLIGVLVYILFSIPTWAWLCTMSLTETSEAFYAVSLSFGLLIFASCVASLIEDRFSSLLGLVAGLGMGLILLRLTWGILVT